MNKTSVCSTRQGGGRGPAKNVLPAYPLKHEWNRWVPDSIEVDKTTDDCYSVDTRRGRTTQAIAMFPSLVEAKICAVRIASAFGVPYKGVSK